MTNSDHPSYLSERQQREVCAVLTIGCDRETAASYANCSPADMRRQMDCDLEFAAEVRRAEAASEVTHMRNVQNASREEKNWRASVWWLERRAPERYGRRDAGALTPQELRTFVAMLVAMVVDEIRDGDDLQRLLARFDEAIGTLQESGGEAVTSVDQLRLPPPADAAGDSTTVDDANEAELEDGDSA